MSRQIQLPNGQTINATGNEVLAAIKALEVIEPEKITCLEYRILLKIADAASITEGGILKPSSVIEKELFANTKGVIVNMGAEAFCSAEGQSIENRPEIGDKVVLAKYAGLPLRDEKFNLFRFCNDKDVVAVIKNKTGEEK